MSGDELVISFISMAVAGLTWASWYVRPRQVRTLRPADRARRLLDIAPIVSAAALLVVLKTLSAHDVRDDVRYLGLYFLLGAAWVGIAMFCIPVSGVSVRDDVQERGNASAAWVIAGAMLGITLCFAGGNIGDGPGWWVVIFSAGLATAGLFAVWLLLEALTSVSDTITIDRDVAGGVRLGGFLVACGLRLGWAVAGDWVSAEATLRDFATNGWLVLVLLAIAVIVERVARPTPAHPVPSVFASGIVPALIFLAGSLVHVLRLGIPG
jgi:hypothetical protein